MSAWCRRTAASRRSIRSMQRRELGAAVVDHLAPAGGHGRGWQGGGAGDPEVRLETVHGSASWAGGRLGGAWRARRRRGVMGRGGGCAVQRGIYDRICSLERTTILADAGPARPAGSPRPPAADDEDGGDRGRAGGVPRRHERGSGARVRRGRAERPRAPVARWPADRRTRGSVPPARGRRPGGGDDGDPAGCVRDRWPRRTRPISTTTRPRAWFARVDEPLLLGALTLGEADHVLQRELGQPATLALLEAIADGARPGGRAHRTRTSAARPRCLPSAAEHRPRLRTRSWSPPPSAWASAGWPPSTAARSRCWSRAGPGGSGSSTWSRRHGRAAGRHLTRRPSRRPRHARPPASVRAAPHPASVPAPSARPAPGVRPRGPHPASVPAPTAPRPPASIRAPAACPGHRPRRAGAPST